MDCSKLMENTQEQLDQKKQNQKSCHRWFIYVKRTFLESASLSTYVKRFSFLGRVEPAVLPALPTRCIEGSYLNLEQLNLQSSDTHFIRALGSQDSQYLVRFSTAQTYSQVSAWQICAQNRSSIQLGQTRLATLHVKKGNLALKITETYHSRPLISIKTLNTEVECFLNSVN